MAEKRARRKILCRCDDIYSELTIYTNGEVRYTEDSAHEPNSFFKWKIVHVDGEPQFHFSNRGETDPNSWQTEWAENCEYEINLAKTVVQALLNIEMDNILKGEQ